MSKEVTTQAQENGRVAVRVELRDLATLPTVRMALMKAAHENLDENEIDTAALLGYAAGLVDRMLTALDVGCIRPEVPALKKNHGKGGVPALKTIKVKHVYGQNGLCEVDHGSGAICGLQRQRKPRAGSSAASGVEDEKTGHLFPDPSVAS